VLLLLQVLLLVLSFLLLLVLKRCFYLMLLLLLMLLLVLWRSFFGDVAVADSGVDASAGPIAGAVEALNIAGAVADAIAVALLEPFLVLYVLFSICKTIQFYCWKVRKIRKISVVKS
jgi:hypothetical protein